MDFAFSFLLLFQTFLPLDYCHFSAPNRVAASRACENECCFRFTCWLHCCSDDDDRLFSRHHVICTHVFTFDFQSVCRARYLFLCATSNRRVCEYGNCMLFFRFLCAMLLVAMVMANCHADQHGIYKSISFSFSLLDFCHINILFIVR
jgi:hypothetical protein